MRRSDRLRNAAETFLTTTTRQRGEKFKTEFSSLTPARVARACEACRSLVRSLIAIDLVFVRCVAAPAPSVRSTVYVARLASLDGVTTRQGPTWRKSCAA